MNIRQLKGSFVKSKITMQEGIKGSVIRKKIHLFIKAMKRGQIVRINIFSEL